MKSGVYKYRGKMFRYDFDECLVEHVYKAGKEDMDEEAEWIEKHGRPLIGIDEQGYIVSSAVGLRRENWKKKSNRDQYLDRWCDELDEEAFLMEQDFIK